MGNLDDTNILGKLILIVVLTFINAFFAASEMAMVSTDKIKIMSKAEAGNKKAIALLKILEEPSRFLSTIQVGITLAGFFSSASAAVSITALFGEFLNNLGIPFGDNIAFIGITIILSYIMLVFGELVPKRIALNYSEKFSMFAIKPISFVAKIAHPFVSLLSYSTNAVIRLLGVSKGDVESKITLEEISSLVEVGHEQGVINPLEREMIKSAISFDDKLAEEIMTARTEVYTIDINDDIKEYIDDLLNLKYSRIPVYSDDIDNIIGILYLKDYLLEAYKEGFYDVKIRDMLRPPYFVPERKNINDLFIELKNTRNHMAILIDEYGGFSGIVTMEDLIEEIMGDIDDEFDHDEPDIKIIKDGEYIVRGSTSITEFNKRAQVELDDSEEFDTIAGLIIYKLGYIPEDYENITINYQGLELKVMEIDDKRIAKVSVTLMDTSK